MKQINFPYWEIYLLLCYYTILLWKRAHLLRHHICWGLTDTNKNCDQSSSNMAKNLTSGKMNMDVHIEKLIRPPNYFRNYQKSSFVHGNIQEELKPGRQSCLKPFEFSYTHGKLDRTLLTWHAISYSKVTISTVESSVLHFIVCQIFHLLYVEKSYELIFLLDCIG